MACTLALAGAAQAQPASLADLLPGARAAGSGRLVYWGFEVYDASLWVTPGFSRSDLDRHAFALELSYLRAFSGADIARRSIEEMRRGGEFSAAQAARWTQAMANAFADVKEGDRLMGVHRPGGGVLFLFNGRRSGEIADPLFARLFFGIWLGPRSSEPALRDALQEGTPP